MIRAQLEPYAVKTNVMDMKKKKKKQNRKGLSFNAKDPCKFS